METNLTEEELTKDLCIKVAELLGWRKHDCADQHCWKLDRGPERLPITGDFETTVPKYTTDMNAIAEVEKTLSDDDFKEYYRRLYLSVKPHGPVTLASLDQHMRNILSATAAQRCEALIRTLSNQ